MKIDKPILSAADRAAMSSSAPAPAICLVKPQMGENIGAACRAMANFGLEELLLVAPRDGWPNEKAIALASGASWPLEGAKVFATTNEAIAGKTIVFATSGTPRQIDKPLIGPAEAVDLIKDAMEKGERPVILFGSERIGLDQMDLISADYIVTYPTDFRFPSLNLAQSVAIFCHLWAVRTGEKLPEDWNIKPSEVAERKYFDALFDFFTKELDEIGFFWPQERKENMVEVLRGPMVRAKFSQSEINLFYGAIRAISEGPRRRYLESKNKEIEQNLSSWFLEQFPDAQIKEIIQNGENASLMFNQSGVNHVAFINIASDAFKIKEIIPPLA